MTTINAPIPGSGNPPKRIHWRSEYYLQPSRLSVYPTGYTYDINDPFDLNVHQYNMLLAWSEEERSLYPQCDSYGPGYLPTVALMIPILHTDQYTANMTEYILSLARENSARISDAIDRYACRLVGTGAVDTTGSDRTDWNDPDDLAGRLMQYAAYYETWLMLCEDMRLSGYGYAVGRINDYCGRKTQHDDYADRYKISCHMLIDMVNASGGRLPPLDPHKIKTFRKIRDE